MTATSNSTVPTSQRLVQLDALRGLLMALMALDHANHFISEAHSPGEYWGGPFPTYDGAMPFLLRWITHVCAPGFFFLMGVGMALYAAKQRELGHTDRETVLHFLARGSLLIALQFLIVNWAWRLSPGGWVPAIYVGVLSALGGTMIISSGFLRPRWWGPVFLAVALALVMEGITPATARWQADFPLLYRLLWIPGGDAVVWVNYPILQWLELTLLGIGFGSWIREDTRRLQTGSLWLGTASLLLFVALRGANGFGNLRPRPGNHWIDYLNAVKYPPSLTFNTMTMGLNLLLLAGFTKAAESRRRWLAPLVLFGRTPLVFYIAHLFLYALMGHLIPGATEPGLMIVLWIIGLLLLAPVCWKYLEVRRKNPENGLLRLL